MNKFIDINSTLIYEEYKLAIVTCIMIIMLYPVWFVAKRVITLTIKKSFARKGELYNKTLERNNIYTRLMQLITVVYFMIWSDVVDQSMIISPVVIRLKHSAIQIYAVITVVMLLNAFINIGLEIFQKKSLSKKTPIALHAQILKIILISCSILACVSVTFGVSISSLFASLGAAAALLTFVFKDTLTSLMASLQVTFQDIIRVGDWVSVPSRGIDGDVEKITITLVLIRNFDRTTTTVPTGIFLNEAVQNWRSMVEKGGRRIKRALSIDMDTIKIYNQQDLDLISKLPCMLEFARTNKNLFNAANDITNITMFRHYVSCYLKHHQGIHKEGFTFLVRQLAPTAQGLPLELYVFTKDTNWINYEAVQSEIFEHLLGVLSKFNLKVFQYNLPSLQHH